MHYRYGGFVTGVATFVAVSTFLVGCGLNAAPSTPPKDTLQSAQALFKANCSVCHALDLQGGDGPSLQHVGKMLSESAIISQLKHGGGIMPAFANALGPNDIKTLAAWLAAKK